MYSFWRCVHLGFKCSTNCHPRWMAPVIQNIFPACRGTEKLFVRLGYIGSRWEYCLCTRMQHATMKFLRCMILGGLNLSNLGIISVMFLDGLWWDWNWRGGKGICSNLSWYSSGQIKGLGLGDTMLQWFSFFLQGWFMDYHGISLCQPAQMHWHD